MIKKITIKNFKSYIDSTLNLSPITILIGANASGKTNALEAIRFLSWIAQGQKLSSLQYKVNQNEQLIRGNIQNFFHSDKKEFSLECSIVIDETHNSKLSITFENRKNDELHISEEKCSSGEISLYGTSSKTSGSSTDIEVKYNNFSRGGNKKKITCNDQQGIFTQLSNSSIFSKKHEKSKIKIPSITKQFEKELSSILFLDLVPQKMRGYSYITDKKLNEDGSNFSSILFNYCEREKNGVKEILSFIKSLPEQDIDSIGFYTTPRSEAMIVLNESFGNHKRNIDAGLLSDGTLRVLGIGAALLTVAEGSLIIIEEMDNGVHPSRTKQLFRSIKEIAEKRNLNVIISTHNHALLNAVPNSIIPDVVFCYRDKNDGSSKLVNLEDIPNYPELISQDSLGNLVTRGLVEKYAKTVENIEEKKKKALEWLEMLK
jgi:predicted ATPase